MSFTVKGDKRRRPEEGFDRKERLFISAPQAPTYGELQKSEFDGCFIIDCEICGDKHPSNNYCRSKPQFPPSVYYSRCPVCLGYHPTGRCWFEYLRSFLFTPTHCENCQITHIGFCKETLFCQYCNHKHNFANDCTKLNDVDLSNNPCPTCGLCHSLHCPSELAKIKSDLILWCNRCKIQHSFMNCTPFCNKCFRRHRQGECPPTWTHCALCNLCHQGESCPGPNITLDEPVPNRQLQRQGDLAKTREKDTD